MPQCYPHGAFFCWSGQRHAHRWPPGGHGGFPNCPSFPPVCPVYTTAGETASVIIAAFLSRLISWKCDLAVMIVCLQYFFSSMLWLLLDQRINIQKRKSEAVTSKDGIIWQAGGCNGQNLMGEERGKVGKDVHGMFRHVHWIGRGIYRQLLTFLLLFILFSWSISIDAFREPKKLL